MEEQIIQLLAATQSAEPTPRKSAELQLSHMYPTPGFALALGSIGSHDSVPLNIRQAALLYMRQFVQAAWSPDFDEFRGQVLVNDEEKLQLRQTLLELALNSNERKIRKAASYVCSKIGSTDFPDEWPDLLPTTLRVVQSGTEDQIGGALKLLADLIDESFNEEQFFGVARELVDSVYNVATNDALKTTVRALAILVFRGCFDILEMVMEEHKDAVQNFADETLTRWVPFFLQILQSKLPNPPTTEEESQRSPSAQSYRGLVALKLQAVKALMRIRQIFPSNLAPQSPTLFTATWEELSSLQNAYQNMFIQDSRPNRLEDDDGLPYTLDWLVLEELDFMKACLKAAPVKKELEGQLQNSTGVGGTWVTEVMKLIVAYAQITTEEEGLWNFDVNIFLSEESGVTANYTSRTACGDLATNLSDWLKHTAIDGLLSYVQSLGGAEQDWKSKESTLYLLSQFLLYFQEAEQQISAEVANGFVEYVNNAIHQSDEFLRARGYLVAGSLIRCAGTNLTGAGEVYLQATMNAINNDDSDVVKVACVRAMQFYIEQPCVEFAIPLQGPIINMLSNFVSSQDLQERAESDDFMAVLIQTIRDSILLDTHAAISLGGLDLLFRTASYGAGLFMISAMVSETFEEVTERIAAEGADQYSQLCEKILPMVIGAFRIGDPTEANALLNLAADLLTVLTKFGSEPLPNGFVGAIMPKLTQILLQSNDDELLKSCTASVKNILTHDHKQLLEWQDATTSKYGLEVILLIIDRLLGPHVEDNAGAEVGGLAAELVEKAGSERLGPYLMQLLQAVAVRLGSATQAQFIQSLILVFARLALTNAKDVVDFLGQVQIGDHNGLDVVIVKWLENSVNFAGYDEIRQNVLALTKLYELEDPRLSHIQVKGDLIVPVSDRIMTRSRAKLQPDEFTVVPANLKIIKVLVEELQFASGSKHELEAAALEAAEDEGSDDEDWEDDPNTLDFGGANIKELMAFADENPGANRQRDDETQAYLIQFFHQASQKPGFNDLFSALTAEEQNKLQSFGA
ncbi:ARM repeat-containing protein [Microthyrium microscopicum]|uniref:ARM repeat-containing protein n=1 Tax=Microthyrium microscopicum TaxID=703497 RepID=A0A6A6U591_9PEZI|nr:ARM repeat-containing protein [Microthyrium microscopicum]